MLNGFKKWKIEEHISRLLKRCLSGVSGLPPHLPVLSTGRELCWIALLQAGLLFFYLFVSTFTFENH